MPRQARTGERGPNEWLTAWPKQQAVWPIDEKAGRVIDETAPPPPPRPVKYETPKLTLDAMGHVVGAEIKASNRTKYDLQINRRTRDGVQQATSVFSKNGKRFLTVETKLSADHWVGLKASGDGVQLEWTIDFSKGRLHKPAPVTGKAGRRTFEGTYDSVRNRSTVNIALESWLTEDIKADLEPFKRVLARMTRDARARATEVSEESGADAKGVSWGKVACWGFGGMGAAAACIGTAGIGCVLAGGAFAAAASFCCQQY